MANTSHTQPFHEGDYVTDRRRLYRVLQIVPVKFKKPSEGLRPMP